MINPSLIFPLAHTLLQNKTLFVIGWIFLTYTPFTIVALTVTSPDLEDGGFVCPGVPITLNCTTVGSQGLAWRSQEYIGHGEQLVNANFRPLFYNVRSRSVNTTVATLTRKENGILESTLRIIPTLNHLTSSVVCVHTDSDNSTLPFTVRVIAVPATPPEMISKETMDRMDNCVVHLAWRPPANIDSSNLSHYMIHIDGENVANITHTVTNTSSLQQFAYPLCTCGDHTVSIQAVSRCELTGSKTGSFTVVPSRLSPLTCDAQTTQPIPTTQNDEIINLRKEVKSYKSDLIGTTIFLCLVIVVLGGITIALVVLYAIALCRIKQLKNEKKNKQKNAFELAKKDEVEMDQKSTISENKPYDNVNTKPN